MHQLKLGLQLGWRFARSKHSNGFITFISASSILGIALGTMVLIVVLSAMNGFERELRERLLSVIPHGELMAVRGEIDDWQKTVAQIESMPQVISAAPVIEMSAIAEQNNKLQALSVRGVDVERELNVSAIATMLQEDKWQSLDDGKHIILGRSLAKKLNLSVGDKVNVLYSAASTDDKFRAPKRFVFTLIDVFEMGGQLDAMQGYVSLESSQLMTKQSGVGGIRVKIADIYAAPQLVRDVAMQLNEHVYIHDWTRTQGHLYKDIQLVRMVMWIVLSLVIAVACFNIVSTLVMAVKEKRGDIAILMTMGMQRAGIMLIFSIQGLFNGVVGSVAGCVLGGLLANNLPTIIKSVEQLLGSSLLSADIYFINFIPSQLNLSELWVIGLIGVCLAFLATLYPAFQATRIKPAEQLGNL